MARNMIVRLGVDASDFQKKMAQAGMTADATGKKIRKGLNVDNLGAEVAKIMGWSGQSSGVGSITAQNVGIAQNQLGILRSYRDQLAGAGFDDYQFGLVSERIKALEYDIDSYAQSLNQAADAEREVSREASDMGRESGNTESSVSRTARAFRNMENSGRRLSIIPGFIRRIADSSDYSSGRLERMVRTIRNVSVVSFGLRIARGLFGEFSTIIRNHISQDAALQAQVNGLSASLGQALAPAINIATSAFSYLRPYVVGISNAIGQLMSALTGGGWSAAAAGANKTAAATGGAAKAQKELNRQLLSFDQINRMESQKDTGGGGGSAGSAITPIEAKTPVWVERLKSTFSELFNSSEFQSANIGGKIGQILQTGLDWLGSEGMRFDWSGVGTKLRENFDSFMTSGWGESLFYNLGIYLGGFGDFIAGILGPQWEELKTAYKNEGWQGATAYILGMGTALVTDVIGGLFTKVLGPMFSGIADFFREHGEFSIAGFFEGCAQAMANVGAWIKEKITDPIVNYIKNLLGIHSPSTVFAEIGENCMSGLGNGFSNGMEWIFQKLEDLKSRVINAAQALQNAFSFEWRLPHLRLPHLNVQWDPVDNILAQFFGVTAFPRLNVDWYAKGFITNGTSILNGIGIGERGREALLPLDSNDGWKDEIAHRIAMILDGNGGGGDVNATINLMLDGNLLTSYVLKGIRRNARAGTANI